MSATQQLGDLSYETEVALRGHGHGGEYAGILHHHDAAYAPLAHAHDTYQATSAKGQANGYAGLGADGKVPPAQLPAATGEGATTAVLGADATAPSAANTLGDVAGLSFPVAAGQRYRFRFYILYTAAAATTGSRWSVNGPAASLLAYRSEYTLTATARTTNEALGAYNLPAASNASSVAGGALNVAVIEGVVAPSASGTIVARFASEVANSAIVAKAGSHVEYRAI